MDFNLLFIYFITVNKYRFCISVIGNINMQIIGIGIGYKKKSISVDHYQQQVDMHASSKNAFIVLLYAFILGMHDIGFLPIFDLYRYIYFCLEALINKSVNI